MSNNRFDPNANWKISGVVDTVRADSLVLWMDGFNELQTVPRLPIMPKWMLHPDVPFNTSIPRSCVQQRDLSGNTAWGFFSCPENTDLNMDELYAELRSTLEGDNNE